MSTKAKPASGGVASVDLGANPVNEYQAREYARESSPSTLAVLVELAENARDNANSVTVTIDVAGFVEEKSRIRLLPKSITCVDNGTGLTHREFLKRFCGAFEDSDAHHDTDRAGRNGVGTKTYTSIASKVLVRTTTARPTEGFLDDLNYTKAIAAALPRGLSLPQDGDPDTLWRSYEFHLHKRLALPSEWTVAEAEEMGTIVELSEIIPGVEIDYDVLLERFSFARDWLQIGSHSFVLELKGKVPDRIAKKKVVVRPWDFPKQNWDPKLQGRSDQENVIFDQVTKLPEKIKPNTTLKNPIEFDFRVVGKGADGQMQSLDRPALLLEICGALPYAPNLEHGQSGRNMNLLTFVGLEHASSIGAFCNAICGWARVSDLELKKALRNNKTTLASGPGDEHVQALRAYLLSVLKSLHRAWYNATRAGQDAAATDAMREAQEEVNAALKGANRSVFAYGQITQSQNPPENKPPRSPVRRHRWECGSCGRSWLADAGFTPTVCAEVKAKAGPGEGCGSSSIGQAKNQPRIGDCQIRVEQLGDRKVPSSFQFERSDDGEEEVPVVLVNKLAPRYVELRGSGPMSQQAQKRLKQYLVDIALLAIALYTSRMKGRDFADEIGELYYSRMLRVQGVKAYEAQVARMLSEGAAEDSAGELALALE